MKVNKTKEILASFIENDITQNVILATIIFNAILLGVMTDLPTMAKYGHTLEMMCHACVAVFSIELFIKLYVYKKSFFKDGWNNFDFIIVLMSWVPTGGAFSSFRVFRILRALRALRLISQFEKLRIIVQAIIVSIPNVGWASVLLLLIFYIFSIMGTTLFATDFPQWFGNIGKTMYTLFQVMTLESWSMGIARPVIAHHSMAWIYFISFILVSSFIVMNVIVGVVVNAIGEITDEMKREKLERKKIKIISQERSNLENEFFILQEQMKKVETLILMEKRQKEIEAVTRK